MKFKPEVDIPKNVRLNTHYVDQHFEEIKKVMNIFLLYPDLLIDMITPSYQNFELYFYQRIFMRAVMRYRYTYTTAPRAFSKSFICIFTGFLKCVFLPGSKFFIVAPGKEQGAKIAQEKIDEILDKFPILKNEILKYNKSKDYTTLIFKNGSVFDVVGALNSTRGGRRHGGIIDEIRDHDGDTLNEIVFPLMNVDRKDVQGEIDPTEPNQQQNCITSAGDKGSYAYNKLIELFVQSILAPESTFCWGMDYRVPMMHGLLNKSYIEDMKLSSTFKPESFAREYLSIWTGGSSDSWISYDKMSKYRTIINTERRAILRENDQSFYYMAVDVARTGVNTSIQVVKAVPKENYFQKKLVYSETLHDMHFSLQAIEIKRLYSLYQPREIMIDGTGVGVGLMDFMVLEQIGDHGEIYPPFNCYNDDDYKDFAGEKIIYLIKISTSENALIHSNCFTQVANGHCRFLIKEQEAKMKLLATKKGQKMTALQRAKVLTPYTEATRLFEEICNLSVKQTGSNLAVEQINTHIPKDRFSAFEYALWGIKKIEDDYYKKARRKKRDWSRFVQFSKGARR